MFSGRSTSRDKQAGGDDADTQTVTDLDGRRICMSVMFVCLHEAGCTSFIAVWELEGEIVETMDG